MSGLGTSDHCKQCEALSIRIEGLEKLMHTHVLYQERAVDIAHKQLSDRLAGMNEFRETLKDQASRFVTRDEVDLKLGTIQDVVQAHQNVLSNWQGQKYMLGIIATMVSTLISGTIVYFLKQ